MDVAARRFHREIGVPHHLRWGDALPEPGGVAVAPEGVASKKLASLVAIDVAGYSRSTEANEEAAVSAVAALRARIVEAAKTHGGRLFNTAGDGFMLEFASVAGALLAAEEIASGPGPARRVGVHLGDVTVTPEGDLLGHGVNVAARIQQMASPGAVLASGDVKRAIRGPLGDRLKPQGSVRLNKMNEVVPVFALGGPEGGRTKGRQRKLIAPAAIALGVLLLLGLGLWEVRGAFPSSGSPQVAKGSLESLRVAAPRFDVLDSADGELRKFAGGLQAEMVDQLNQNRIHVASPDLGSNAGPGLTAAYSFTGAVERDGDKIVARVQLNDTRQHVTVWSQAYSGAAGKAAILQDQIAAEAAEVASEAVRTRALANGDTDITSLLIKSDLFADRNADEDRESEWENDKLLLARLPRLSFSHSNFAVVSVFLAAISTPQRAAELRALAAREANTALQLNPHDALVILARTLVFPMVGHWLQRENELLAGLKADPQSALLTTHESNFLREVGRLQDALSFGRQAAAPQPPTPNRDSTLLIALSEAGRSGEAASLADAAARAWPTHPAVWNARLQTLIHQRLWIQALALFRPDAYRPDEVDELASRAWIAALKAMASGDAASKRSAARLLAALPALPSSTSNPPHVVYSPGDQIGMLAILGANDEAFARAADYLKMDSLADSSFLFWPDLAAFRRDKRFWPFVSRIGLVDYWRASGKWPDFCSTPGLPYDCKGAAARPPKG